jgi:8-oxo-dGTP diphosphatase
MKQGPAVTVDVIIEMAAGRPAPFVLVKRRFPPLGWALPGGFVDLGETLEAAAVREAREETGLLVQLTDVLGCYSDPKRDPRRHTVSIVFVGQARGTPQAGDDAAQCIVHTPGQQGEEPLSLAFDHATIVDDYVGFFCKGHKVPLRGLPGTP